MTEQQPIELLDSDDDDGSSINKWPPTFLGGGNNGNWPPALRAYVERVFTEYGSPAVRPQAEAHLRRLISRAMQRGTLWAHDWAGEPLPSTIGDGSSRSSSSSSSSSSSKAALVSDLPAGCPSSYRQLSTVVVVVFLD